MINIVGVGMTYSCSVCVCVSVCACVACRGLSEDGVEGPATVVEGQESISVAGHLIGPVAIQQTPTNSIYVHVFGALCTQSLKRLGSPIQHSFLGYIGQRSC